MHAWRAMMRRQFTVAALCLCMLGTIQGRGPQTSQGQWQRVPDGQSVSDIRLWGAVASQRGWHDVASTRNARLDLHRPHNEHVYKYGISTPSPSTHKDSPNATSGASASKTTHIPAEASSKCVALSADSGNGHMTLTQPDRNRSECYYTMQKKTSDRRDGMTLTVIFLHGRCSKATSVEVWSAHRRLRRVACEAPGTARDHVTVADWSEVTIKYFSDTSSADMPILRIAVSLYVREQLVLTASPRDVCVGGSGLQARDRWTPVRPRTWPALPSGLYHSTRLELAAAGSITSVLLDFTDLPIHQPCRIQIEQLETEGNGQFKRIKHYDWKLSRDVLPNATLFHNVSHLAVLFSEECLRRWTFSFNYLSCQSDMNEMEIVDYRRGSQKVTYTPNFWGVVPMEVECPPAEITPSPRHPFIIDGPGHRGSLQPVPPLGEPYSTSCMRHVDVIWVIDGGTVEEPYFPAIQIMFTSGMIGWNFCKMLGGDLRVVKGVVSTGAAIVKSCGSVRDWSEPMSALRRPYRGFYVRVRGPVTPALTGDPWLTWTVFTAEPETVPPQVDLFNCEGLYIPYHLVCDGFDHCAGGVDESYCTTTTQEAVMVTTPHQHWTTSGDPYLGSLQATEFGIATVCALVALFVFVLLASLVCRHYRLCLRSRRAEGDLSTISMLFDQEQVTSDLHFTETFQGPPTYEDATKTSPPPYEAAYKDTQISFANVGYSSSAPGPTGAPAYRDTRPYSSPTAPGSLTATLLAPADPAPPVPASAATSTPASTRPSGRATAQTLSEASDARSDSFDPVNLDSVPVEQFVNEA